MSTRARLAVGAIMVLVIGAAAWSALRPLPIPAMGALVVVREGDGMRVIAERLHRGGVIASPLAFRVWARLQGLDRSLKAGEYRFTTRLGIAAALRTLSIGSEAPATTIPEGLTVGQIAALLAERGYGSIESFLCVAADPEFLSGAGVPGPQLEGYLFPDTYRFSTLMAPDDILATMVRRFHERFDAAHHRRVAARGVTLNDLVTLASIIEKETAVQAERALVAAVFANRLRLGMPLQSDPTVIYGIPNFGGDLTRADLTRASPYNTYATVGLPAGPIANPGMASIEAALAPADVPYLYFVSRNDGTHEFSATLAEHNRAVARYQRPSPAGSGRHHTP